MIAPPPAASPGVPAVAVTCEAGCTVDAALTAPPSALLRITTGTRGAGTLASVHLDLPPDQAARSVLPVATALGRRLVGSAAPGRLSADLAVTLRAPDGTATQGGWRVVLGADRPPRVTVGRSVRGRPVRLFLPDGPADLLVMAAIHGDEPQGAWALADALVHTRASDLRAAVMVVANPDGYARRTRRNARGVDLNRNYPTRTWGPAVAPGPAPASEPETRAVLGVLRRLAPRRLVTLHADMRLVEDPEFSPLGRWLARRTGLPLARSVGYATPGSLGDWATEHHLPEVTVELPAGPPSRAVVRAMRELMAGRAPG